VAVPSLVHVLLALALRRAHAGTRAPVELRLCAAALACVLAAVPQPVRAVPLQLEGGASYPTRVVRLIVPFPPGATTDSIARILALGLGDLIGRNMVIDNRGGAGGTIGTGIAARATADGHTLLVGTLGTLAINPFLYPRMDHDPGKDLAPISLLAAVPNVLVVNADMHVYSLAELIRYARRRPGELNYGSAGNGSSLHLGAELFKSLTGVMITHVPYRGGAPALTELLGGHIQMMFNGVPLALPHVTSGKLRALAVTGERRSPALLDVPTMSEAGLPGFEFTNWFALLAPARTPFRTIDWLSSEVTAMLSHGDTRERLAVIGAEPCGSAPGELAELIRRESGRWSRVIRSAGIKPD
jgi:tripartite-type tricarboxylate transporter receptor subunit TctC